MRWPETVTEPADSTLSGVKMPGWSGALAGAGASSMGETVLARAGAASDWSGTARERMAAAPTAAARTNVMITESPAMRRDHPATGAAGQAVRPAESEGPVLAGRPPGGRHTATLSRPDNAAIVTIVRATRRR